MSTYSTITVQISQVKAVVYTSTLVFAQVLWLGDNQITGISGLEQLTALQELNLARNQIEVVGSALDVNSSLHTLNLADNRIGSFKQVLVCFSSASAMWLMPTSLYMQSYYQQLHIYLYRICVTPMSILSTCTYKLSVPTQLICAGVASGQLAKPEEVATE